MGPGQRSRGPSRTRGSLTPRQREATARGHLELGEPVFAVVPQFKLRGELPAAPRTRAAAAAEMTDQGLALLRGRLGAPARHPAPRSPIGAPCLLRDQQVLA
eukprot:7082982-Pyramimonas_sp.AAC.1